MTKQNDGIVPTGSGIQGVQVIAVVAFITLSVLAGCTYLRDTSADPNSEPDVNWDVTQNELVDPENRSEITIEIAHAGGDPVNPDQLEVQVDGQSLDATNSYRWAEIVGQEESFDNIDGQMAEGDIVTIYGGSSTSGNWANAGDTIEVVWKSKNGETTKVLLKYEIRGVEDATAVDGQE